MNGWRHRSAIAAGLAIALSGCTQRRTISGGGDGHVDLGAADGCAPGAGVTPRSCGGTVSISGTTPVGSFAADVIYALRVVQCSGQLSLIEMEIGDTPSRAVLLVDVLRSQDDGGAMFVGRHAASAVFHSPEACQPLETPGTVEVTEHADPGPGSAPGLVKGTVSFQAGGFALTGSFDAPYCGLTSGRGCP